MYSRFFYLYWASSQFTRVKIYPPFNSIYSSYGLAVGVLDSVPHVFSVCGCQCFVGSPSNVEVCLLIGDMSISVLGLGMHFFRNQFKHTLFSTAETNRVVFVKSGI